MYKTCIINNKYNGIKHKGDTGDTGTDENENGQDQTPTTDHTLDDDKSMVPTIGGLDISHIMFSDEEKKDAHPLPSFPYNQFSNSVASRSNASHLPQFYGQGFSNSVASRSVGSVNNHLPMNPWKNSSNSIPQHRRIFSEGPSQPRKRMHEDADEGPKEARNRMHENADEGPPKNMRINIKHKHRLPTMSKTVSNGFYLSEDEDEQKMIHKQASFTAGGDIDELRDNVNIKEDEFIIIGDDENDDDNNNHNRGVTPIGGIEDYDYNFNGNHMHGTAR